jgi:transcriptional regulator with XRE-family HTH domain
MTFRIQRTFSNPLKIPCFFFSIERKKSSTRFETPIKSTTFGKPLREVREIKNMSQDELAKKLDMHGAVIGRYERDEVKPSIEMAAAIAEALEVSLNYLVGNSDLLLEKNVLNKIMDIQKLGSEDRAHVFALLDAFLQSHKAKKVFAS